MSSRRSTRTVCGTTPSCDPSQPVNRESSSGACVNRVLTEKTRDCGMRENEKSMAAIRLAMVKIRLVIVPTRLHSRSLKQAGLGTLARARRMHVFLTTAKYAKHAKRQPGILLLADQTVFGFAYFASFAVRSVIRKSDSFSNKRPCAPFRVTSSASAIAGES